MQVSSFQLEVFLVSHMVQHWEIHISFVESFSFHFMLAPQPHGDASVKRCASGIIVMMEWEMFRLI
jgi:hypothetical protein